MTSKADTRRKGEDTVMTYQDVLDEAIEETFPASDPIAPAVANAGRPVSTRRNPTDWKLERRHADATPAAEGAPAGKARAVEAVDHALERLAAPSDEIDAIYRALKRGGGREHVNDGNVDALIDLARERGDARLEVLLREWRAPCGDDPDMPRT